ncbi:MAG: polysaccharide pyruvyl transferase family protein [Planctomycetota bacterium]|jgi:hypothetical protein
MKKVGVITMHRPVNVGCFLQAYALQETISKLGYDCEIIDYYYPNAFHKQSTIKTKIKKLVNKQLKRVLGGGAFELSEKRFKDCLNNRLNLSSASYRNIQELQNNPPEYDLYCVGSDQVWNPNFIYDDPSFFCDFAPSERPIVSYASSFGASSIPEEYQEQYKKYLTRFKALGVREQSGVELIHILTGREAELVVDPTLLLSAEEWKQEMSAQDYKEPYILCYGSPYPNVYVENLALHIQKQTGLKIVHLFGRPWQCFNKKIKYMFDAGPLEFLSWINNAELVLTTSFHGTIFSISFKRPFYSVYPNEERGSRQLNILKCLQLESRGVKTDMEIPLTDYFEIDFETAHSNLDQMRKVSYDYVKKMLSLCD